MKKINLSKIKPVIQIIPILIFITSGLYLLILRNDWYANFYRSIEQKSNIKSEIIYFIILAFFISINDFLKGFFKTYFIKRNRNYAPGISQETFSLTKNLNQKDYAQRFCEDTRLEAETFLEAIDYWGSAIGTIFIFLPRMWKLIGRDSLYVTLIILIYTMIIFLVNFGYIKEILQKSLYKFEESEADLRNFLIIWLHKQCIRPIKFSYAKLKNATKSMQLYYVLRDAIKAVREFYQSLGLIIPFAVFYSFYANKKIDLGTFFQLINIWSMINLSVTNLAKGIEEYFKSDLAKQRLVTTIINHEHNENIIIKNLSISIMHKKRKKKIISNFSITVEPGQKINIVAGKGKTSIMRAIQGMLKHKGEILMPRNALLIPEQPIIPANFIYEMDQSKKEKFKKNCEIIDAEFAKKIEEKNIEKLSGAEKWKILAAYSLCFDCVIWDDPFWGLDASNQISQLLPMWNTILIFSQQKIDEMQVVELN